MVDQCSIDAQKLPPLVLLANRRFCHRGLQGRTAINSIVFGPRSGLRRFTTLFPPSSDCSRRNARLLVDVSERKPLLGHLQNPVAHVVIVRRIRQSFSASILTLRFPW